MTLLFRVIYAHGCRSTHHKFALDALAHLRDARADGWRRLFLQHHDDYLIGAKAPDTDFRDFRNHVLHVRDNYWGGAERAARRWYDASVRAFRERRWRAGVYFSGVLSHYYTDVIQPFHTGQSEAENNIHRAAEWSIFKAYDPIHAILQDSVGLPEIDVPEDDHWLETMVRRGAEAGNKFYEELIGEYDFAAGVKRPPEGLNLRSRQILAGLFGHAIIGFSRILDRVFQEADVAPPDVNLTLQGFLQTLTVPIRFVVGKLADAQERRIVSAMYRELQETGKVEQTLPEDDRIVRDAFAREVRSRRESVRRDRVEPSRTRRSAEKPSQADLPSRPVRDDLSVSTPPERNGSRSAAQQPKFYLELGDPVVDAPSIGPKTARRLERVGVRTVRDLLQADPGSVAPRLNARHITESVLIDWQDQARLVCRVAGLRGHDAQLLVGCDYRTPEAVAQADPSQLFSKVATFTRTSAGKRVLRGGKAPDQEEIHEWIAGARRARTLQAA